MLIDFQNVTDGTNQVSNASQPFEGQNDYIAPYSKQEHPAQEAGRKRGYQSQETGIQVVCSFQIIFAPKYLLKPFTLLVHRYCAPISQKGKLHVGQHCCSARICFRVPYKIHGCCFSAFQFWYDPIWQRFLQWRCSGLIIGQAHSSQHRSLIWLGTKGGQFFQFTSSWEGQFKCISWLVLLRVYLDFDAFFELQDRESGMSEGIYELSD